MRAAQLIGHAPWRPSGQVIHLTFAAMPRELLDRQPISCALQLCY